MGDGGTTEANPDDSDPNKDEEEDGGDESTEIADRVERVRDLLGDGQAEESSTDD